MRPSMLQRPAAEPVDGFRRVLVYGDAEDATLLLRQSLPLIAGTADIRLVEPGTGTGEGRSLEGVLTRLRQTGARIRRERLAARDAADIVTRAAGDHDLVLKATAPGGTPGVSPDALDRELLASGPCTVWFGRYGRSVALRRIAAAVDCPEEDEGGSRLAERILTLADALATTAGAELHVVHAWFLFGAEVLKSHVREEELRTSAANAHAEARRRLAALLHRVPSNVTSLSIERVHAVEGPPDSALPRFLNWHGTDVAVIGTRGRRGRVARALFPQLATRLLRESWCSVVVVRSDRPGS